VEDDSSLQNLYKIILKSSGFEVSGIANNGEEAVRLYKNVAEKPDIIIMDHRMPIKNGLDATKEILELGNESKIVFASADASVKNSALSAGAISFLEKPFSVKKLVEEIKRITGEVINTF